MFTGAIIITGRSEKIKLRSNIGFFELKKCRIGIFTLLGEETTIFISSQYLHNKIGQTEALSKSVINKVKYTK